MKEVAPLWICLVTRNNLEGVKECILSIQQQILRHQEQNLHVMILDKSSELGLETWLCKQDLATMARIHYFGVAEIAELEACYFSVFEQLAYDLSKDSIQRARLQLTIGIYHFREQLASAILWLIDDDVLFQSLRLKKGKLVKDSNRNFFGELRQYRTKYPLVDAAIGITTYAPPIPILLYAQTQFRDIFQPDESRVSQTSEDFEPDSNYHDLYADSDNGMRLPVSAGQHPALLVENCLRGIPVTRPILRSDETLLSHPPTPTLLRGANFIIFSFSAAIALPHVAFQYDGIISRRSDMIHAWMLQQAGYQLQSINLSLIHNRKFPQVDTVKICREYMADALGAIAFRYLAEGPTAAHLRLEEHQKHIASLLQEMTNHYNQTGLKRIEELIQDTQGIQQRLSSWNWNDLLPGLNHLNQETQNWIQTGLPGTLQQSLCR